MGEPILRPLKDARRIAEVERLVCRVKQEIPGVFEQLFPELAQGLGPGAARRGSGILRRFLDGVPELPFSSAALGGSLRKVMPGMFEQWSGAGLARGTLWYVLRGWLRDLEAGARERRAGLGAGFDPQVCRRLQGHLLYVLSKLWPQGSPVKAILAEDARLRPVERDFLHRNTILLVKSKREAADRLHRILLYDLHYLADAMAEGNSRPLDGYRRWIVPLTRSWGWPESTVPKTLAELGRHLARNHRELAEMIRDLSGAAGRR